MIQPAGDELWDALPDAMLVVDASGLIVASNRKADETFEAPTGLVGHPVDALVPSSVRSAHHELRAQFARAPRTRSMGSGRRLSAVTLTGTTLPVTIALSPLGSDESHVLVAVRDVRELVASEDTARAAERRSAIAEDQRRIARDLHDNVIQQLFAIGMGLGVVRSSSTDDSLRTSLASTVGDLNSVISEIRGVIFDITPDKPVAATMRAVLADLANDIAEQLGLDLTLTFVGDVDGSVPDAVGEHLVAAVRELMTNVARHSGSSSVSVSVSAGDDIEVVVEDRGTGFSDVVGRRSGLTNLSDRAAAVGGSVDISEVDPQGTRVRWWAPIAPR